MAHSRLCHDGKIKVDYQPPENARTFWLFDRILYLKPKREGQPVLCRSRDLDVEEVVGRCMEVKAEIAKGKNSSLGMRTQKAIDEYLRLLNSLFDNVVCSAALFRCSCFLFNNAAATTSWR